MNRRRNGRFAPACEVPPLLACKQKHPAAVALGKLAAEKARERRAAWVAEHIAQLKRSMA